MKSKENEMPTAYGEAKEYENKKEYQLALEKYQEVLHDAKGSDKRMINFAICRLYLSKKVSNNNQEEHFNFIKSWQNLRLDQRYQKHEQVSSLKKVLIKSCDNNTHNDSVRGKINLLLGCLEDKKDEKVNYLLQSLSLGCEFAEKAIKNHCNEEYLFYSLLNKLIKFLDQTRNPEFTKESCRIIVTLSTAEKINPSCKLLVKSIDYKETKNPFIAFAMIQFLNFIKEKYPDGIKEKMKVCSAFSFSNDYKKIDNYDFSSIDENIKIFEKVLYQSDSPECQELFKENVKIDGANKIFNEWSNSGEVTPKLLDAIEFYKKAATLNNNQQAMKHINDLCDKEIPYACIAKYELINDNIITYKKNPSKDQLFFIGRQKETELAALKKKICTLFNKSLEDENPRSMDFFFVADLYYQGKFFYKNLFVARLLFKKAVLLEDQKARYRYAFMCFHGEGGVADCGEANAVLEKNKAPIEEKNIDELLLMAEIAYIQYLNAVDCNNYNLTVSNDSINNHEKKCCEIYYLIISLQEDTEKSLFCLRSLFLMAKYDNSTIASEKMKELRGKEDILPIFKQILSLGILETSNNQTISKEKKDNAILEKEFDDFLSEGKKDQAQQKLEEIKKNYGENNDTFLFSRAKFELIINNDPLILRNVDLKLINKEDEIDTLLLKHYKKLRDQGEKVICLLISSLCYELKRNEWCALPCRRIHKILTSLDSKYDEYDQEKFSNDLKEIESSTYYDESPSDDSDSEQDELYRGNDKHRTIDEPTSKESIRKISSKMIEALKELYELADDMGKKTYESKCGDYQKLFTPHFKLLEIKNKSDTINNDLMIINHFYSKDQLENALLQISTNFVIAQIRGIHFATTHKKWSQTNRRAYRKNALDKDHPFKGKPIYSSAVYERAGVHDFNDTSEITQLRLLKVARYINQKMLLLHKAPAHSIEDFENLKCFPSRFFEHKFKNRNFQVQQLYSTNYRKFHSYLEQEKKCNDAIFVSDQNPFVSTGDINSIHSTRYAYGNKFYAGYEESRLRPKYQKNGAALRPHVGAVLLTLHPLKDYINHNHLVSLNNKGSLIIQENIIPERECSFFSYIDEDRLKFIHIAKYPSFHHKKWLKIFLLNYGIDKEAFDLYKKLFQESSPHSYKRRLVKYLLGEYLSAYQTLFLMHQAVNEAEKMEKTLLYRNRLGNFSLKPSNEKASGNPNGNNEENALHRFYTKELRSELKGGKNLLNTDIRSTDNNHFFFGKKRKRSDSGSSLDDDSSRDFPVC